MEKGGKGQRQQGRRRKCSWRREMRGREAENEEEVQGKRTMKMKGRRWSWKRRIKRKRRAKMSGIMR